MNKRATLWVTRGTIGSNLPLGGSVLKTADERVLFLGLSKPPYKPEPKGEGEQVVSCTEWSLYTPYSSAG